MGKGHRYGYSYRPARTGTRATKTRHRMDEWCLGCGQRCGASLSPGSLPQSPALNKMVARGYIVVAPDYAGLGSTAPHGILSGRETANSLLDAVRAAGLLSVAGAGRAFAAWGNPAHFSLVLRRWAGKRWMSAHDKSRHSPRRLETAEMSQGQSIVRRLQPPIIGRSLPKERRPVPMEPVDPPDQNAAHRLNADLLLIDWAGRSCGSEMPLESVTVTDCR